MLATARKLESLDDLKAMGMSVAAVDVCAPKSLAAALSDFGPVDIVIANAGCSFFSPLVEQPLERFKNIMDTNVTGVVATVQAVAPSMIERRSGVVVVTGSVSGAMITPFAGAYCASKAAVTALCEALLLELDPFGIAVVNVITGAVKSSFSSNADEGSSLGPTSTYAACADALKARTWGSQQPETCVTPAAYAKIVVDAALSTHPPPVVVAGGKAPLFHAIGQHMPRSVSRRMMTTNYGLFRLGAGRAIGSPPAKMLTKVTDPLCMTYVALLAKVGPRAVTVAAAGVVLWLALR